MSEQALIRLLRGLPVAVIVTPRSGAYAWQCLERGGSASDLAGAVTAGLAALIEQLAGDSAVVDDLLHKQN